MYYIYITAVLRRTGRRKTLAPQLDVMRIPHLDELSEDAVPALAAASGLTHSSVTLSCWFVGFHYSIEASPPNNNFPRLAASRKIIRSTAITTIQGLL